ncbi:MAG: DegT/DnrJ/EryC1/StrS family aminotransferase [Candidatus Latescibacterota bacterium]|jgi:dTDP-4-amino-4,6-dideoxygalactose transaminase
MGEEEAEAAARIVRSGLLAQGREVELLEKEMASFTGRRFAVAVSSGTAALHLGLLALGVGPGEIGLRYRVTYARHFYTRLGPWGPSRCCVISIRIRAGVTF